MTVPPTDTGAQETDVAGGGFVELLVARKWQPADGVVAFTLTDPDGHELPEWSPGGHIDVRHTERHIRQYSLCGDVADRTQWQIAVLREAAGRGCSLFLHDTVQVGDRLHVRGPRNNFIYDQSHRILFVAGGIGVTPLLPMVEDAVRRNADWQLLYGGRSRSSMAFLDVLTAHGDRVEVRPQDEYGLLDLAGFVGRMPTAPIYACGPAPMLDALQAVCAGAQRQLHVERFAPAPEALPDHPPDAAFDVVLARSGQTLHVGADDTILDVIEATGLNPAWSCREGTCGTCETKILAGRPDHRDFVLTEDERADEDTMMICVSRARTASLTLDM